MSNSKSPKLRMTISLEVLQHLGINLYSNVPAVLSEIVANAWDADASQVRVNFFKEEGVIIIKDDGDGMTREQVVKRFLLVGYRRRKSQAGKTSKGRSPMGRKGIGKLSLFSIAKDIVVETARDGEKTAFRMRPDEIEDTIRKDKDGAYEPEEPPHSENMPEKGTSIVLSELRKPKAIGTASALRKRLARRFSIIGPDHGFEVFVNDETITPEDRGYFDRLQYIWTYGDQRTVVDRCKHLDREREERPSTYTVDTGAEIKVSGWLGTVQESKHLKDDPGENLNRIAIFVRGKMAQEGLLGDFTERGIYASYLIGELRIDDLDTADGDGQDEDSATTGRQRLVEDDPRYIALKRFVREELKFIQKQWSDLRTDAGAQMAMEMPGVKKWLEGLPSEVSKEAKHWIGRINRLGVEDYGRKELIRHAVLAFEFYRSNQNLAALNRIGDKEWESVLKAFRDLDDLELALYGQIVRQRVAVVRTLKEKVEEDEKERAIQEFVFNHLWLLTLLGNELRDRRSWKQGLGLFLRSMTRSFLKRRGMDGWTLNTGRQQGNMSSLS